MAPPSVPQGSRQDVQKKPQRPSSLARTPTLHSVLVAESPGPGGALSSRGDAAQPNFGVVAVDVGTGEMKLLAILLQPKVCLHPRNLGGVP